MSVTRKRLNHYPDPELQKQLSICPDYQPGDLVFVHTYGLHGQVECKDGTTIGVAPAFWVRLRNGKLARALWYDLEPKSE